VRRLFALWFGLTERVDRKTYLRHGAFLTALKFAGDCTLVRLGAGRWWTPLVLAQSRHLPNLAGGSTACCQQETTGTRVVSWRGST
jgi:hypothetical protein